MKSALRHKRTFDYLPEETVRAFVWPVVLCRSPAECTVKWFSPSEALLVGKMPFPVGSRVLLRLSFPPKLTRKVSARIISKEEVGNEVHNTTIQFEHLDAALEDRIQTYNLRKLEREREARDGRILILDDSPQICRILERQLSVLGEAAVSATTYSQAMDMLGRYSVNVALVDLVLEGQESGITFLNRMAMEHPEMRRILMSGFSPEYALMKTVRSGLSHAILAKPWTTDSLLRVVHADMT